MGNVRAQVILKTVDGVPENWVTNTWYFAMNTAPVVAGAATELWGLYDALTSYMSPLITQNGHNIKWYDMADPEPRAPITIQTLNLTSAPSGTPLPPEVALCLSYQGVQVSGIPQARRRGRIYFGPLDTTALGTDGRPAAAFVSALRNEGQGMLTASEATTDWSWIQYSTVNDGFSDVDNGWVDNEFDTQRRRGRVYTSRTTF